MNLTVTSSPHIRGDFRTSRLMLDVVLALLPALFVGVATLGFRALVVTLISIASAIASEALYALLTKKPQTVRDCSAIVTGLLFAMTLPASVPCWLPALGSAFAIIVVKLLCGGLGQNIFNPALLSRAAMLLLFPAAMTRYTALGTDAVTSATPLHHMVMPALPEESLLDMFLGKCPGSIGELSSLALILGGVYLIIRKVISPRIPLAYLGTVALLTLVFSRADAPVSWMLYSLFSGGVMLGAIFMATDYATSPVTKNGQVVYGIGCGALTVLFRYFGLFPEGVTYAILLMNLCVWEIDRFTTPRRYGEKRGGNVNA
ncbi:MAG: RnfABCDGE type electron transport complex subunit D [Oscillospiraceae bacterium]|nr:RnfABCDGE type electron transport complex subunit D [Oscillospiraceae bacterium]